MTKLTGERFLEDMTSAERKRAEVVESVLPTLKAAAEESDQRGEFFMPHVETLSKSGLLGLIVPEEYGGMGGTLRDLAAATYAMGTVCASTALAFFFHCSSASRGLLALEALEANLFSAEEAPVVQAFAEKVLTKMGRSGKWLANFASESTKTAASAVTISTEAKKVAGGWLLNGVKSFGCATGVADEYLVTAMLEGTTTAEGLALFFIKRDAPGVSERIKWDAVGMRATATHGIVLKDVFVEESEALALPGAFVKMMQMSRGSFVGNQMGGMIIYLGAAQGVFDYVLRYLTEQKFADTGRPLSTSPFHQQLIGEMAVDLETGYLWMRRQLQLETSEPPILPKPVVVRQWRMCKGETCEAAFRVAVNAFKACGTSNTMNNSPIVRGYRDITMGLVQAFPAERGRLEVAKMITDESETALFGVKK